MDTASVELARPTSRQIAVTLLPFALAVTWAFMAAFAESEINYFRTVHLIWMSLLFATAALAIYGWTVGRQPLGNYWRLTWTFALALYLLHFFHGFIVMLNGEVGAIFELQGYIVANGNFLLTAVWIFDVAMAWLRPGSYRPVMRFAAHVIVLAGFIISTMVFGSPTAKWFGAFMIAVLLLVAACRYFRFGGVNGTILNRSVRSKT